MGTCSRHLAASFLLFAAIASTVGPEAAAQSESLCYAYWHDGDIYTHCGGVRQRVTHLTDVETYAIDLHGDPLLLLRYQQKVQQRTWMEGMHEFYESHNA